MTNVYVAPGFRLSNFNCPHCGVRATQYWGIVYHKRIAKGGLPIDWAAVGEDIENVKKDIREGSKAGDQEKEKIISNIERAAAGDVFPDEKHTDGYVYAISNLHTAQCDHCSDISIWLKRIMIFPTSGDVAAHLDLPEPVRATFVEAAKIVDISPRASAALARLAIQQLCIELKCSPKKTLDEQIGELVAKGLDPAVSQMLDGVRVIGNNAVHPGEIDMKDDRETARFMLECINRIVQRIITEERQSAELFDKLPQRVKDAIAKRNEKALAHSGRPAETA